MTPLPTNRPCGSRASNDTASSRVSRKPFPKALWKPADTNHRPEVAYLRESGRFACGPGAAAAAAEEEAAPVASEEQVT